MEQTTTTPALECKIAYHEMILNEPKLKALEGNEKEYYPAREAFKQDLSRLLRYDFSVLESKQILKLASLVSTYRPVAPHSFLITCGNLIGD